MRASLLACSLLLLAASVASASGTHIRWNACYGDGGVTNRNFACDTNTGSEILVGSFTVDVPVDSVYQVDAIVNFAFAKGSVPAWWQFKTVGSCRAASLIASTIPPASAVACVDWADGARDGLVTYRASLFAPYVSQLEVLSPTFPSSLFDLAVGQEYFALTAIINHQKTVGTDACAGCDLGACIGFVGAKLMRSATVPHGYLPPGEVIILPAALVDQVVTWQGGAGIAIPNYLGAGWTYCPGATPARNRTWGAVKAIYR